MDDRAAAGRYLSFALRPGADHRRAVRALCELAVGRHLVLGLGASLIAALGRDIAGLRSFVGVVGARASTCRLDLQALAL